MSILFKSEAEDARTRALEDAVSDIAEKAALASCLNDKHAWHRALREVVERCEAVGFDCLGDRRFDDDNATRDKHARGC